MIPQLEGPGLFLASTHSSRQRQNTVNSVHLHSVLASLHLFRLPEVSIRGQCLIPLMASPFITFSVLRISRENIRVEADLGHES